ncbi:MAG: LdpA C-terminal domain-containing domain [Phormidesmis sp.]
MNSPTPLRSLQSGSWFKLICGASYQALPSIRNLTLAYALAGADCIDMAADMAVVAAAKAGLDVAARVAESSGREYERPWLMVSMSAGEDPHFRKAWFDPAVCPADCPRPCESICPADAIGQKGVVRDRCYGCGRCLPMCPLGLIEAKPQPTSLDSVARQVLAQVDALEIHTHVGQQSEFEQLWQTVKPWTSHLSLISVSCPDGEGLLSYLENLQHILSLNAANGPALMWQTDGRPMSGDLGKGTTHAAIRLAQKVIAAKKLKKLRGYVQLAGGTNKYTVSKLTELGLLNCLSAEGCSSHDTVAGVAYGSFARSLLMPVIEQTLYLEEVPSALWRAVKLAESLVDPLKGSLKGSLKRPQESTVFR